jgi:RNA-directed DNA polymerase
LDPLLKIARYTAVQRLCAALSRLDACVVGDLNRTLRGWFGYFKHAHPFIFVVLDGFIRRRLRALLRKQQKRPGLGICRADHQRWPNAFFANAGLFALHTAWQAARQSR